MSSASVVNAPQECLILFRSKAGVEGLLVHFFDEGTDFVVGELADVVAKEDLVFGEGGQGRRNWGLEGLGHINTFWRRNGGLVILTERKKIFNTEGTGVHRVELL